MKIFERKETDHTLPTDVEIVLADDERLQAELDEGLFSSDLRWREIWTRKIKIVKVPSEHPSN